MDKMSPQQDSLGGLNENKRRLKSMTYRRQSAPSLVITKALNRSKTLSRDSFVIPVNPESCPLVQCLLASSNRSFLLHGHAQLKSGMQTQDRHLFLFNDILVIAKAKSANHFKQKVQVCVCEMWTAGCLDEVCESSTFPEKSFVMGWPTSNCVAMFSSADQKDKWLSILKSRIKEEKEKEEPKTIPLRVYGKGINTYAVTKTLPVSNSDSTNEVIRLALQQFGIIGNVKDFQLWVISKRDNSLYPLIGHEFPFSIQMSHVRYTMAMGGSRDTPASPADRQRAMQVEQMQVYRQCRFILKPRPTESLHVSAEMCKKPFKRRRSLITWAFWRGSSYNLSESSEPSQGRLFCQPLKTVCMDNKLPKPVMDMLVFLYHEGSCTRGIFRRPAGARAVRELRDSLDMGVFQLPLTKDNVFIIAGVFKDFLRSIPGSLLCSELHEEWMDVLEEDDDEEEQVQDVKRMVSRLPKENVLLLRYLLAMLHGIQSNVQENQMTSFNLSVCIAPSILWPPGLPCSPEVEGEGTKKVCELVKFMIEHCQQILGENPATLFGGPPQSIGSEDVVSDSWLYPLTDSSYDSLENDLDNSSGGSPGFYSRGSFKTKALQGSLDSILTFSDYDQDVEPDAPERTRLQEPELHCPIRDAPIETTTSSLEWNSLDPRHRQRRRRCSEPAIAYMAKFQVGSDAFTGDDEDDEEEFIKKPTNYMYTPIRNKISRSGARPAFQFHNLRTEALKESPPISPAPTDSSLDSPCSEPTWATRRGDMLPSSPSSTPSTTFSASSAPASAGPLDEGACQKGSSPKELETPHPECRLKRGRRLSRSQQNNLEKDEDPSQGGPPEAHTQGKPSAVKEKAPKQEDQKPVSTGPATKATKAAGEREPNQGTDKPQQLKKSSSPPSHHRSTGSLHISPWVWSSDSKVTVKEVRDTCANPVTKSEENLLRVPSPSLFYKQGRPSLSLLKESRSKNGESKAKIHQRRVSEPFQQVVERASSFTRARLPSDPGLKVTNVDWQGEASEARFCLTPYATKAVKEYFSSHRRSNPQSSQQVALALVEGRREWLKRCSDAKAEPDFEQLLFAEESFV